MQFSGNNSHECLEHFVGLLVLIPKTSFEDSAQINLFSWCKIVLIFPLHQCGSLFHCLDLVIKKRSCVCLQWGSL